MEFAHLYSEYISLTVALWLVNDNFSGLEILNLEKLKGTKMF